MATARKRSKGSGSTQPRTKLRAVPTAPEIRGLSTAHVVHVEVSADGEIDDLVVRVAGRECSAQVDGVHPAVIQTAAARKERVLVEIEDGEVMVLGALRTQPTPGIEVGENYVIEARNLSLKGGDQVSMSSRAAGIAIRAAGEVETVADRIISRAEGVHKIIGRMLRLN